ncbi:hypothetical protein KMP13_05150 [Epibacterium ulvae]|uniref:hypothetical protein n=1 Tax=Epibacterium ulvae TaxID=1156985 RepID=UPI001BFC183A|nr:hypothetical protein [Epibacterium ulvae]MBT8153286.1 hypothetical protein [Epibacterium ulvae]
MTDLTLSKTRFRNGLWEGRIEGKPTYGGRPMVEVRLFDTVLEDISLTEGERANVWNLSIRVPVHAVCEGVQTFVIFDTMDEVKLGEFTLIGGDPASDDIRAEIELLRAELDMLKRAFRRHCRDTA